MAGTLGHHKGSRGERGVANLIAHWWHRYEPTARFMRTPQSGGWQYGDRQVAAHFNACGDLMTTSAQFPFCVEVKWREKWSVDRLLDGRSGPYWDWWQQTIEAAKQQNGVPMMWMRRNRIRGSHKAFPWLVWVPEQYVKDKVLSEPDIEWPISVLLENMIEYGNVLPVVYDFNRFVEMAPHRMKKHEAAA